MDPSTWRKQESDMFPWMQSGHPLRHVRLVTPHIDVWPRTSVVKVSNPSTSTSSSHLPNGLLLLHAHGFPMNRCKEQNEEHSINDVVGECTHETQLSMPVMDRSDVCACCILWVMDMSGVRACCILWVNNTARAGGGFGYQPPCHPP